MVTVPVSGCSLCGDCSICSDVTRAPQWCDRNGPPLLNRTGLGDSSGRVAHRDGHLSPATGCCLQLHVPREVPAACEDCVCLCGTQPGAGPCGPLLWSPGALQAEILCCLPKGPGGTCTSLRSDCRQCHQDGHHDHDTYHHHWREGNLPLGARCEVCRKTCGSSDVLAGVRCGWCGIQAHSLCSSVLAPECTFGQLRSMVLPPGCVRLLSRNFSKMHCFRIAETAALELGDRDDGVDGSAASGPGRDAPATPESSKQTLEIFDGNDTVRRNRFRLVTVPRLASSEEVLEAALRVYYVSEDPGDFELQELPLPSLAAVAQTPGKAGSGGLAEEDSTRGSGSHEPEAWVIRARPRAQEVLKIYPGWLKVGVAYVSIRVTSQSTVRTVVLEVLPLLGRQAEDPENFQLMEVLMGSRQVQRMVLADEELLLERLWDIRQTSLRQASRTRFYVVESRAVAPRVSLFVGGLPPGLSPRAYGDLLHEAMATKGAVVLDVTCFAEAERLYMLGRDTAVHGQPLTTLVLPDVLHTKLPPDCCPLLVFVNPKSGGLKGRDLLCSFRKLLNPHQVFDLTNGGPLPGFHLFAQVPCFRVLVCGGDGTVGWVLTALEETRHRLTCQEPSVAILPLGTGNDLGRVLRWGAGYSGEDPLSMLVSVDEADAVLVDRWTILLDAHKATGTGNNAVDTEPPKIVQMSNYCGIGIDAELSLDFHQAREEEPGKFTSRFHNKGVYVRVGLQKISHSRGLHKEIRLQVEQREVELPSIEGLIFINIPSWGSGADLWGSDSDSRFEKPRMDDGLLEVVGVTGVVHMGQVQGGLRSGIRIAQGSYFRVTLLKATPVQVDGEPWVQAPGHMIISVAGPKVCWWLTAQARWMEQVATAKRWLGWPCCPGGPGPPVNREATGTDVGRQLFKPCAPQCRHLGLWKRAWGKGSARRAAASPCF
ncbi:diacylglycerol kinase theta isoform X3 [Heterocephalus glaber]|uniref:Diacylglycerol kinase n=1 Tax=Heterocephalus glaber TaxID=10181 RepID=A0AAX6T7S4_HETGA|nr:diacylglycerol kinase theta isoform X3 [Heterocephalus glaber]